MWDGGAALGAGAGHLYLAMRRSQARIGVTCSAGRLIPLEKFLEDQETIRTACVDTVSHREDFEATRFGGPGADNDLGSLRAIVGNMGASKSAHLILAAELLCHQRVPHLVVSRPEDRERYADSDMCDVVSAVGIRVPSVMVADLTLLNPKAILEHGVRVILLDEIQFNDRAEVQLVLYEWALFHGIDVIVAGLRTAAPAPHSTLSLGDAPAWETMSWILAHASEIQICKAACFACGTECDHTMVTEEEKGPVDASQGKQSPVVAVGSTKTTYNPVCATCYANRT